jgi:DNA-directed RNA polymerase specialized sigma24 family protein
MAGTTKATSTCACSTASSCGIDPLNRALLLLYLEDRSHREIADILGISEGNVATKISRLKQRIRNDMA